MTVPTSSDGAVVLIVEDHEDSRYVYQTVLEGHGFEVLTARSGDEGLRIARELLPDVILMDVSIPVMDGWTVTQHLKEGRDTSDIPVIIVTAHAFPEDARRAETVGSDGFLTKPCDPLKVLEEVRRLLGD